MMHRGSHAIVPATAMVLALAAAGRSQCTTTWLADGGIVGTNGFVSSVVPWDPDGAGPAPTVLVLGGDFTAAGNVAATDVATWDPASGAFGQLSGPGVPIGRVGVLAVTPNGDLLAAVAPNVFVPGSAHQVLRWTGASWAPIGGTFDGEIWGLTVLPNGTIVAGGYFLNGGAPTNLGLARWNGVAWTRFGTGINGYATALATTANGDLIVGGQFTQVDGVSVNNLARWNGSSWSPLGGGVTGGGFTSKVHAIAEMPTGDLVVGGLFDAAGGVPANNIARWSGSTWSALGAGVPNTSFSDRPVASLLALPSGALVAGGFFDPFSGVPSRAIARWDGTAWSGLGLGFGSQGFFAPAGVAGLALLPGGPGDSFAAVGAFRGASGNGISLWNGTAWQPSNSGFNGNVHRMVTGPAGDVIAVGEFTRTPNGLANGAARWDGTAWSPLGSGLTGFSPASVAAIAVRPDGDILVGGRFSHAGGVPANGVARWSGGAWSAMGAGIAGEVNDLALLPNGDWVAGGNLFGGNQAACVLRWDGVAWTPLGGFVAGSGNGRVAALHVLPDGRLVAGGTFSILLGSLISDVAVWNGVAWSPLGSLSSIQDLATTSNGALIAATANGVSRWTGSTWVTVGTTDGPVYGVAALPAGGILAAGGFQAIGGVPARGLARWDGFWTNLGQQSGFGITAAMWPQGELALGGTFVVGNSAFAGFAKLGSTCPFTSAAAGAGCPSSGGSNTLRVVEPGWIGSTLRTTSIGVPANSLIVAATGFTPTNLPLANVFLEGQPGCVLHVVWELAEVQVTGAGNSISTALTIPNALSLVGVVVRQQQVPFEFSPSGTLLAVTATNALSLTIGAF
jgi:trimeric autotransporter adhesin